MPKPNPILESIHAGNLTLLRAALKSDPEGARSAQVVLAAAGRAWKAGLDLLVRHGAGLNGVWRGYRPLHALIQTAPHGEAAEPSPDRIECLGWLLEHGADPEQLGAWPPARALLVAAFMGAPEYVDKLVAAGAIRNGFVAAALGDVRQVGRSIREDEAFPLARDAGGLTALQACSASRMGKRDPRVRAALMEIASLLIERGADPNARTKGWSHELDVSYFAAWSGNTEIFELLLKSGADVNSALVHAAWQKGTKLAECALQNGAVPDRAVDGDRPLLNNLIRWGQFQPAMWLIGRGASANVPDERGWTAVHQAVSRGNERMLQAVLEAGGDPFQKDKEGHRAVDLARAVPVRRMLAKLLKGRAAPVTPDPAR